MLLWLQRACADDLPVKIKSGFKDIDVYTTCAKLIVVVHSEARAASTVSRALYSARTPLEQALFGEYISKNINIYINI